MAQQGGLSAQDGTAARGMEITIWGALGGIVLGAGTELVIKAAGG